MDINDLEQEIIKLSRKHNIPQSEVKKIWNYQFKEVMRTIKVNEDNGCNFKLRGLGIIQFLPYKLEKIKQIKQKKYEREILSESSPKDGDRIEND
jgi:hypothetical protein